MYLTCLGNWAQKAIGDVWPSPETLTSLKKQAVAATGSFYKFQEELVAKGADVTSTFLEFPPTKAVITQATTALDTLEREAHRSFCNCLNDPLMKDLAIQFQNLNKQTSEALENVKAHPTALDAKTKYNELSKQTTEAYAAFIVQSPAARNAANTVQNAVEQADTLCRVHPVLCGLILSGLIKVIFPGTVFDKEGPGKKLLEAWAQRTVGAKESNGSPLLVMQNWGMKGALGEAGPMAVGGPIAALLLARMKRDWSPEGCKNLMKVGEKAKL